MSKTSLFFSVVGILIALGAWIFPFSPVNQSEDSSASKATSATNNSNSRAPKKSNETHQQFLSIVVSDASSIKVLKGCIRLGGSFRTATEKSQDICESQKQIDGAFSDSVKYIEADGCAEAIVYSDANFEGTEEQFSSC